MTTTVKLVAVGVLALLALRKKAPTTSAPPDDGEVKILPVEDEPEKPGAPVVGEFWRWPSDPLPLIRTVGSEWGVYNPTRRTLMAVVNKNISQGDSFLVVSVSATSLHPFNFPTRSN